jgi:hypothetical protein
VLAPCAGLEASRAGAEAVTRVSTIQVYHNCFDITFWGWGGESLVFVGVGASCVGGKVVTAACRKSE